MALDTAALVEEAQLPVNDLDLAIWWDAATKATIRNKQLAEIEFEKEEPAHMRVLRLIVQLKRDRGEEMEFVEASPTEESNEV